MSKPVISVIIPVYNNAAFIGQAIESVRAQDLVDSVEVIVVDDGSTDGSGAVARRFPDVRVFERANGGISAARNEGLTHATGSHLAFLDADDLFPEGRLRLMLEALGANDAVLGRVVQFRDGGWSSEPATAPLASTMLVTRAAFDRVGWFNEHLKVGEFIDWWARSQEAGLTYSQIEATVLLRRIHTTNTGITQATSRVDYTRVLRAALERRRKQ